MALDFLIFILRFIIEVIFLESVALVGRLVLRVAGLVLRVASLGGVRAAPIGVPYREFNRFYCRRSGDGQTEVESNLAGGIGMRPFASGLT